MKTPRTTSAMLELVLHKFVRRGSLAAHDAEYGLCAAIQEIRWTCAQERDVLRLVTKRIMNSLQPTVFANRWMTMNRHATYEQAYNPALMRAYRIRWLQALINEYKAKGD